MYFGSTKYRENYVKVSYRNVIGRLIRDRWRIHVCASDPLWGFNVP